MFTLLGKEVKETVGLTQEILTSFENLFTSAAAEMQEFESKNGDILYYYKEKPYNEYRLAAIYTKDQEFFQFGIVKPYIINGNGETLKEVHMNSELIKEINATDTPEKPAEEPKAEEPVKDEPKDETPVTDTPTTNPEPEIITLEQPNSLQTDTFIYNGETYFLEDFKWEPGQQGDTPIQTFGKEGSNKKIVVKRPIVPTMEREKPDITEIIIHYMPEDPMEFDGRMYKRISSMDKMIKGKWRPSYIYYNEEINVQLSVTVMEDPVDSVEEIDKPDNLKTFNFDDTLFTALTLEDFETFSRIEKLARNKKFKKIVPGNDHISFAKVLNVNYFEAIGKVISVRGIVVDKEAVSIKVYDLYSETIAADEEFDLGDIEEITNSKVAEIIAAYEAKANVEKAIDEIKDKE